MAVPVVALAQGFVPLAPIPGLTEGATADTVGLAAFFNNLYKFAIGIAAALAVIQIIWAGLDIAIFHKDAVSAITDDKGKIYNAVFGLVLVLSPVLVFSIINPSILNLSLNLPALNTTSGTPVGTGNGSGTGVGTQPTTDAGTTAATTAGCTITGTLLKTAICPTQQAAQDFAAACSTGSGNVPFFTTDHKATCGTEKGSVTGPYSFADTSSGVFATIFGYSKYEPLASTPDNPNNGTAVLQFASSCTADGGTTCMDAVKLPCTSSVVQIVTTQSLPTTSCWNISLSCTDGKSGAGGCDSSPKFTIVTTK
ncbi:MAG: hypothetical protein NUV90_01990 [Candidatus Parcubacteria bacterium]|nr:hypothetical protein [Candidatus Parcubacteria bacterium]